MSVPFGPVAPAPPPAPPPPLPANLIPVRPVIFAGVKGPNAASAAGRYYPALAAQRKVGGAVVLQCTYAQYAVLEGCNVVSETPERYGFAAAALLMAAHHVVRLKRGDPGGDPEEGERVRVMVPFEPGGER